MSGDLATTNTAELKAANSASEDASIALKSSSEETPIAIDSSTSDETSTTVAPAGPVTARTPEQVREAVRIQVEYWLSPQNLANDRYLVNQMDAEMWVSISTILGFSKMKNLTKDPNVVLQALNSSKTVKVDVANQKLQPVLQKVKRTTIIVREMPDNATNESIKSVFDKGNFVGVQSIKPDINNCWFVVFETEELAQKGLEFLRTETYEGQPIKARLKSEPVLKPATNFVYTPSTRAINAAISLQAQNTPEGVPVPVAYFPPMPPYMVPVGGRGRAYGNVNQMRGPQHPRGQYMNNNSNNSNSSNASNNNNAGNSNNNNASNNNSNSYQNHWNNAGSEGNQHNSHDKSEGKNNYGGANSAGGNAANNSGVSGGQSRYQGSGNMGNLNQQRRKKDYQRRNIPTGNTNVGGNNASQTNSSHASAANGPSGISQGTTGGSHNDKSSHSGSGAGIANHSKDDGNSKKKRSQMTKRKGGGKQGQNVQLQLGLAHFPPLPTRGSNAGGYKEDFHKYSTDEMYRIIMALKANTSSLLPCPDVPQEHPAVLKKPTLELELEKYPSRGAPASTTEPSVSAPPAESAVANPYRKSAADVVKSTPAKAAAASSPAAASAAAPAKVSGKSNNAKQNTKHQNANSSKSTASTSPSSQTAAEASSSGSKSSATANAPPSNGGSSNTANAAPVSSPNPSPSSSSTSVSAASSASSTSATSTSASTTKQTPKSPNSSASPPASSTESSSQKQESSSKSNQDASIKSWATIVGKSSTGATTKLSNSNEAVSNNAAPPPASANSSTPVPKPSVSTTPTVEATATAH